MNFTALSEPPKGYSSFKAFEIELKNITPEQLVTKLGSVNMTQHKQLLCAVGTFPTDQMAEIANATRYLMISTPDPFRLRWAVHFDVSKDLAGCDEKVKVFGKGYWSSKKIDKDGILGWCKMFLSTIETFEKYPKKLIVFEGNPISIVQSFGLLGTRF